jgi:hypothetical protein
MLGSDIGFLLLNLEDQAILLAAHADLGVTHDFARDTDFTRLLVTAKGAVSLEGNRSHAGLIGLVGLIGLSVGDGNGVDAVHSWDEVLMMGIVVLLCSIERVQSGLDSSDYGHKLVLCRRRLYPGSSLSASIKRIWSNSELKDDAGDRWFYIRCTLNLRDTERGWFSVMWVFHTYRSF